MNSLIMISFLLVSLLVYGVLEYYQHQKNIQQIPIRIHVNGTRGKSSVTRLVGAGLRAGGYNVITKVTGTFPRLILSDGTEVAIHRKAGANILEQLNIVKYAAKHKADILLIECMALNPIYQKITEHQMIKATHGVITNIRLDHLDVMGPGLQDVGNALALTIPKKSKLFTSEDRMIKFLEKRSKKLDTALNQYDGSKVSDTDMQGFTYIEHKANVDLALGICSDLGVNQTLALKAMKMTQPDEGVLKKFSIVKNDQKIHFYNALAANDPESSLILWDAITEREGNSKEFMVLINARKDRKERSEQLVEACTKIEFNNLLLSGENVDLVKNMALKNKINIHKIHLLGQTEPESQVAKIIPLIKKETVIVAFGNMGAGGAELSNYFENHQIKVS